jgi:hypothetical protein
MNNHPGSQSNAVENIRGPVGLQQVLFAQTTNPGITIGVVCQAEPSSLALLAAGVSGMAARQARRNERVKLFKHRKSGT